VTYDHDKVHIFATLRTLQDIKDKRPSRATGNELSGGRHKYIPMTR